VGDDDDFYNNALECGFSGIVNLCFLFFYADLYGFYLGTEEPQVV